jgi:REP element-mobilizing transposase RayT
MGLKNRIYEGYLYYLTLTVVDWVDVFTRPAYRHIIVDALKYCQQHKGLELYAWCLMSNHLHLIAGAKENYHLSNILRDFKKHTSRTIVEAILKHENESRRQWMLHRFAFAANLDPKVTNFKFWQDGNEAKEITSNNFLQQKLDYIHQNPGWAEIVAEPENYLYSSASNYAGQKGLLEVLFAE